MMSVPAAIGATPLALFSNAEANCCRARRKSSVNTPRAAGVQPLRSSCELPKDSVEISETTTRLLGGSVTKS